MGCPLIRLGCGQVFEKNLLLHGIHSRMPRSEIGLACFFHNVMKPNGYRHCQMKSFVAEKGEGRTAAVYVVGKVRELTRLGYRPPFLLAHVTHGRFGNPPNHVARVD